MGLKSLLSSLPFHSWCVADPGLAVFNGNDLADLEIGYGFWD
jgi:hypothetical protein